VLNTTHRLGRSWMAGAHGSHRWTNNTLDVSLAGDNYRNYTVFERRAGYKQRDNRTSILNIRAVDSHRFGAVELVGGAEINREEAFATEALGTQPATYTLRDGALFAQAALRRETAEVVIGARHTSSSQFGGAFSPSLAAMWRHGRWRLRGGAGSSFRPPSIRELHYDYDHQGMFHIRGNPALKAEKGLYTQLSAEYSFSTLCASATLYNNRIRNKITQYHSGRELHYTNVGNATLRGVDMSLLWAVASRWTLRGAYSLCRARDNASGDQLASTPLHSATASLTHTGRLTVQGGARATSPYTYIAVTGDTRRTPTLVIARAALSYRIAHGLSATATAENIFDTRSVGDPAGRLIIIGLKYEK
jgi:outer membrane receptor for ferrienterochelin and colicins